MDAEKIAPLTSSPLDSARGRGKQSGTRAKYSQTRIDKNLIDQVIGIIIIKPYPNNLSPVSVGSNAKK
jgi:nitrogen regulatory protein PII